MKDKKCSYFFFMICVKNVDIVICGSKKYRFFIVVEFNIVNFSSIIIY